MELTWPNIRCLWHKCLSQVVSGLWMVRGDLDNSVNTYFDVIHLTKHKIYFTEVNCIINTPEPVKGPQGGLLSSTYTIKALPGYVSYRNSQDHKLCWALDCHIHSFIQLSVRTGCSTFQTTQVWQPSLSNFKCFLPLKGGSSQQMYLLNKFSRVE